MDIRRVSGPQEVLRHSGKEIGAPRTTLDQDVQGEAGEQVLRGLSTQPGEQFSLEELPKVVERMNTIMEALSIEARFSIHEPTHTVIVTLVNRDTGEIIRQIPPEKLLDMVARFRELVGLFVDEVV
ncbi:MAG: flagellar protein FlaG [Atribacterota bacterium]